MAEVPSLDEVRLREVFRALRGHAVDYAVFGAVALSLHTVRPLDRLDAAMLAERFGLERK